MGYLNFCVQIDKRLYMLDICAGNMCISVQAFLVSVSLCVYSYSPGLVGPPSFLVLFALHIHANPFHFPGLDSRFHPPEKPLFGLIDCIEYIIGLGSACAVALPSTSSKVNWLKSKSSSSSESSSLSDKVCLSLSYRCHSESQMNVARLMQKRQRTSLPGSPSGVDSLNSMSSSFRAFGLNCCPRGVSALLFVRVSTSSNGIGGSVFCDVDLLILGLSSDVSSI